MPQKKSASALAEEEAMLREIARASEYSAYLRTGPHSKFVERGFPTYQAAKARKEELEREHSRFGRRGLVYAINSLGSFPVDDELAQLAGLI